MGSKEKKHITVSFPRDLIDSIKIKIDNKEIVGYLNATQFCVSKVREAVEDLDRIRRPNEDFEKQIQKTLYEINKKLNK